MMNLYDQSISILEYAIYNIYSIFIDQNIFSYIYMHGIEFTFGMP